MSASTVPRMILASIFSSKNSAAKEMAKNGTRKANELISITVKKKFRF